ncbi:DUF1801 domain-containing protein [bacterium]|nr:DUF1801 domain-containing protein [bacterium]
MNDDVNGLESIDAYIAAASEAVRERLESMRATIHAAAPEAAEAIKYRLPTFVLGKNLVHFGAFRNHIGFYPTSSGIEHFAEELRDYVTSRGAVQFPHDRPLPLDLVSRIVEFRVNEEHSRKSKKPSRRPKE